jgi:GntR family transcriptional regulator
MWQRLDPRSGAPLFTQIVESAKAAMARGELSPGSKLPSVRELAGKLAVNPNTVVRAYAQLEAEGLLVSRPGSGCFVQPGPSPLAERVRRERLFELFRNATTEAFHLGFDREAQRRACEMALAELHFEGLPGQSPQASASPAEQPNSAAVPESSPASSRPKAPATSESKAQRKR